MNRKLNLKIAVFVSIFLTLFLTLIAFGQGDAHPPNYQITPNSVGFIKLGMSINQAMREMPNAKFGAYSTEINGDFDELGISEGSKLIITFNVFGEDERISNLTVRDSRYRLANGVHTGMTIADAEKTYGKITGVRTTYSIETVEFANQPKAMKFYVSGKDGNTAGLYENCDECDPREKFSDKYSPGSYIFAIELFNNTSDDSGSSALQNSPEFVKTKAFISSDKKILWDFRDKSGNEAKAQEFMKPENEMVMKYLFGNKTIENFEITTRVTGSFTKANTKETLYYVGGCDDGDGFKAISNCSHASSWNAGWIAIYDGNKPIRKIEAALGYKIRYVTDVNGDGKEEILSFSGYSGMGETTVRGELGQISDSGYQKIFPLESKFYFGSFERIIFSENDNEADKCYALASVVSYGTTKDGKFPTFAEEYFKSAKSDSNWIKVTKEQFDADQ